MDFSSNKYMSASKEFLESNSIVAKISFLLLIIVLFVILLKISISIIFWYMNPDNSIVLLNGMSDASQMYTFTQDPNIDGSLTIQKSNNKTNGIEFTWSIWIFIKDTPPIDTYQHIFHKGNYYFETNGLNQPNNAPGLYITPDLNHTKSKSLTLIMNTYDVINEKIIIDDITLNKWVNVIIRVENKTLDVYINGIITNSHNLKNVPKQNYGDVYLCANGGFSGSVSNLIYYTHGLGISEIQNISLSGPNTRAVSSSLTGQTKSDYYSLRWYYYSPYIKDQYNP
jgi:hypothetical protein